MEALEALHAKLLSRYGGDVGAVAAELYELGRRDAGGLPGQRRVTRRHANYVESARETAAPILAGVMARHGGELGPTAQTEAMYALRLAGLGVRAIALVVGAGYPNVVRRALAKFQPSAEQERALRRIAGLEVVKPKLSAVA